MQASEAFKEASARGAAPPEGFSDASKANYYNGIFNIFRGWWVASACQQHASMPACGILECRRSEDSVSSFFHFFISSVLLSLAYVSCTQTTLNERTPGLKHHCPTMHGCYSAPSKSSRRQKRRRSGAGTWLHNMLMMYRRMIKFFQRQTKILNSISRPGRASL